MVVAESTGLRDVPWIGPDEAAQEGQGSTGKSQRFGRTPLASLLFPELLPVWRRNHRII